MSRTDSPKQRHVRVDGWTPARQLIFLGALAATKDVQKAAAAAGMGREGAYRLRNRAGSGLFAALWNLALEPSPTREVHTEDLTDGQLMRMLGNHYRRERGDFTRIRRRGADLLARHRT